MRESVSDHADERLNTTFSNPGLIAYEVDGEGHWTFAQGGGLEELEYYCNHPEITCALRRAMEGQHQVLEVEVQGRIWSSTYVPCKGADGTVASVFGTAYDITEHKRASEELALEKKVHERTRFLLDSRNKILELMASGTGLKHVLHELIRTVEAYAPEVRGSIFLVDFKRERLRLGAAPSLPDSFNLAVDRTPIRMGVGCCGTAAFTGKRTIAEKIASHPYWESARDLAAGAGLEACWSEPIYSSDREVLGTFAFYLSEPRGPVQEEIELITQSADIAGIAIERDRAERAMRVNTVLQQMRIEVLHMQKEDDWFGVCLCFLRELRKVVSFNKGSISLVDLIAGQHTTYHFHEGKMLTETFDEVPSSLRQVVATGIPLYRRNRQDIDAHLDRVEPEIMCVVDVPFQGGSIAINALEEYAFAAEEIAVVEQFATVLSEAYRRLQDLQALAQKESQLRQAQKMEAIGQLTAGMAHNFNNRLMVVSSAVESMILTRKYDLRNLELALASTDQAAEMVRQLMLFSRAEKMVHVQPIPLQQVLAGVIDIGRSTFDRKITLSEAIPTDLPLVHGDRTQLEQVFLNLLLNARDAVAEDNASAPEVQLAAKVAVLEDRDLPADLATRHGEYVCVQVIDNGIGMNEETQNRAFEPFFTTKEVGEGTGLGLATVYAIVKEHQGWIECVSQERAGTTFSVYLPVREHEIVPDHIEPTASMLCGTETVLLIEDEDDVRSLLVSSLRRYGYSVLVGRDGLEGLEAFQQEWKHIDLVLLDLSLPKRDGLDVLAQMRALNPAVKVIVSTGHTEHSAEAIGVLALLDKPYRLSQALQTIHDVLHGAPE